MTNLTIETSSIQFDRFGFVVSPTKIYSPDESHLEWKEFEKNWEEIYFLHPEQVYIFVNLY